MTTRIRASAAVALLAAFAWAVPAAAEETPDPKLDQTVAPDEATATGEAEIAAGHVDLGPRLVAGVLRLEARDDTAQPPVWRGLNDVVIRVVDAATLTVPDDDAYDFLGLKPGSEVLVIPQTEVPGVVWLGWNTQHPSVGDLFSRGVTLSYEALAGPGSLHVFLGNGFAEPTPLWDSTQPGGQDLWVDLNTHTHANWVFSAPGEYALRVAVRGEGVDGQEYRTEAVLRFALGDDSDAGAVRALTVPGRDGQPADETGGPSASAVASQASAPSSDAPSTTAGEDTSAAASPAASDAPTPPVGPTGLGTFGWMMGGIGLLLGVGGALAWRRSRRERAARDEAFRAEERLDG